MDDKPKVLRSVLAGDDLIRLLSEQYHLGIWRECKYLLKGLNDSYRVLTEQGRYVLRIFRTEVEEPDVQFEIALINELAGKLARSSTTKVALPIRKKDHGYYSVIMAPEGKRFAVLYEFVTGTEHQLNEEQSCFEFGRSAAELHLAMDNINIDLPRYDLDTSFLVDQPMTRIIDYIGSEHEKVGFLKQFAHKLKENINARNKQGLDWGLCHGDMHGNNNAQYHNGVFSHIDFEWSAEGWRSYDLAQVLISRRRHHPPDRANELWNAIVEGYRSVRSLSEADVMAVEDFAIARRLWVMNLDVAFIESDSGMLDFDEQWLNDFTAEFRTYSNNAKY